MLMQLSASGMAQLEVDSPFQADWRSLLGLVVTILIGAVATAAGVGGGAIYIPLFNVLIGFALKPSTALSQACITAGSLAAVAINLPRTHPGVPDAPLVDFPLMLLLTPLLLVGVGIGVLLNVTLPSWLLNILLLVLLVLLLVQAVAKGRALWGQETRRGQAAAGTAACHDTDADHIARGAADVATAVEASGGSGSRQALLPADRHGSGHPPPPGLRLRRGLSYNGPRGPRGLEPDQEASLGCLEGLESAGAAATRYDTAPAADSGGGGGGGARRRAVDVSWDCMEGVATTDGAASCETPRSSSSQLPSSAFLAFAARPLSYSGDGEVVTAGRGPGASALRSVFAGGFSGVGGMGYPAAVTSPELLSPASSLRYGPSWRAFNELGAMDFETDLDGASDGDDGGGSGGAGRPPRGPRPPSGFGFGFGSPGAPPAAPLQPLPPSARMLSQLLGRPLPPQLQVLPSISCSPGAALRRRPPVTRRSSFDPATGADLLAAAAAGDEEVGPPADSWLQRRSKWRTRFPAGVLPHRGGSRGGLPPRGAHHLPPVASARGQPQQPQPERPLSSSSGVSSRLSGAGLTRLRSRTLRTGDGDADGGGGGGARLDEPLLGSLSDSSTGPYATIPDPGAEPGRQPQASANDGGDAGAGASVGAGFIAADAYRPPTRLETLHEEADDRADVRSGGGGGGAGGTGLEPMGLGREAVTAAAAAAAAAALQSPFAADAAATAGGGLPAVPVSRPATEQEPARRRLSLQQDRAASAVLYGRQDDDDYPGGAAAPPPTEERGYLHIELRPIVAADRAAAAAASDRQLPRGTVAAIAAAAVRKWPEPWAAALRRIPARFAGGLLVAWVVYLALQAARSFQPRCSGAWWALFVVQIVAMLCVSAAALVAAAAALSRQAEAAEADVSVQASEGGAGDAGWAAAPAPAAAAAAAAAEPALAGTAALLVLQAPLATLCATFGAGLTGGLLGLGGGMVMGPLLLQIGVHPQVTAASSSAMVLFSSSAALIQFALLRRLNGSYAAVFGAASLLAGLVGTQAVARAVRRSGRPSLVVLALAGVMATGTVCVAVFGLRQAAAQLGSGQLGFVGMCSASGGK